MKVLVTGSRGFVGAAIVRKLRALGHTVVGAVRRADRREDEVFVDLADRSGVRGIPSDFDVVVHSAAALGGARFSKSVMDVNAGGTQRLLAWARGARVSHFVQISSIGAYGSACVGENRREDNTGLAWFPLLPAYLRSKALAERHVRDARLPATILRLPGVFGADDTVVTPAIVPAILRAEVPWVRRRDALVSTLWVENAATVVAEVIARGPLNDAFNVADGDVRWDQFVDAFAEALGRREIPWKRYGTHTIMTRSEDNEYQYLVTAGGFGAQFPADKLRAKLPGLALASWREGVREAVAAYRAQHGDAPVKGGLAAKQP